MEILEMTQSLQLLKSNLHNFSMKNCILLMPIVGKSMYYIMSTILCIYIIYIYYIYLAHGYICAYLLNIYIYIFNRVVRTQTCLHTYLHTYIQYTAIQYNAIQYSAVRYSTITNAIRYDTIQYSTYTYGT